MDSNSRREISQVIAELATAPEPWSPGAPGLWTDPHISAHMLAAHLDPATDAASRRPEAIEECVGWLRERLELGPERALLDLGCGPGLYARRFSDAGCRVTGVDVSQRSIEYARGADPAGRYLVADYRDLTYDGEFDAALLIYGDFCVLNDGDARRVLEGVCRALKPGGWFALDVTTPRHRERARLALTWSAHPSGGFWRAGPYLLLARTFDYPDLDLAVNQYAVVEGDGQVTVYRNWFHDYDEAGIRRALEGNGFVVEGVYGDLAGRPTTEDSEWLGVVARRPV